MAFVLWRTVSEPCRRSFCPLLSPLRTSGGRCMAEGPSGGRGPPNSRRYFQLLDLHGSHPTSVSSVLSSLSSQELISQMLQVNVEARCTAGQILSHPWVSVSTHVPREPMSLCPPRLGCGADRVLGPRPVVDRASFSVMSKQHAACSLAGHSWLQAPSVSGRAHHNLCRPWRPRL